MARPTPSVRKLRIAIRAVRGLRNWPSVFMRAALSFAGWAKGDIVLRTRTGMVLSCPNDPSSWPALFEVLYEDVYRLKEVKALSDETLVVVDIGAHVGAFALEVARRFPHARVTCYEPFPDTASYLNRNIAANQLEDRISVVLEAVGATSERRLLYAVATSGSNSFQPSEDPSLVSTALEVPVTSFDSVAAAMGGRIDIVKLDCEGSEYDIVLGSKSMSWREVRHVLLEHHPVTGHSWSELSARLEELGFDLVWHQAGGAAPGCGMAYATRREER